MNSSEKPGGYFHSGWPLQGPGLREDEIPAILSRGMSLLLGNEGQEIPGGDAYAHALAERHLPTAASDVDPADAELADAIAKGTEAWSGVHDGRVDELRGGAVEPARAVAPTAEQIAARVPLPEPVVMAEHRFNWPEVCKIEGYTADQLRAAILAGVREAMRGGVAVAVAWLHEDGERVIPARTKAVALRDGGASASSVAPYSVPLYTTPPAGRVEVSEAVVERLRKILRERWGLYLGPDYARAALTAALHGDKA